MVELVGKKENLATKFLAGGIALFLMSFLASYAFLGKDELNAQMLKTVGHSRIHSADMKVSYSIPRDVKCGRLGECYKALAKEPMSPVTPTEGEILAVPPSSESRDAQWMYFRFEMNVAEAKKDFSQDKIFLALPNFYFRQAAVFWKGKFQKNFNNDERLYVVLPPESLQKGTVTLDLLLEVSRTELSYLTDWKLPIFVTDSTGYNRYLNRALLLETGQGQQVGMIARIVLAIFMLVFFIAIDSSAAALGLALTMGFEAAGMCFGNVGLEHQWITPADHWKFLRLFFYSVADFAKLYFLVQISLQRGPRLYWYLVAGAIFGAAYGTSRIYLPSLNVESNWFWFPRMTLTSGIGIACCLLAMYRNVVTRDHWRTVSLGLAIVGASVDILDAIPLKFPVLENSVAYNSLLNVLKAGKAYVYTLSGVVVIIAMRKELQRLQAEEQKNLLIAHEMKVGRDMQMALLQIPELPEDVQVYISHEPATFVSGDTYFVDWNQETGVLTILLNDVPGHGLQAALKAFACNVIAKDIWGNHEVTSPGSKFKSRFARYERRVSELLRHRGDMMPFNAFVGMEVSLNSDSVTLYRSNYLYPIIMRKNEETHTYTASVVSIANSKPTEMKLGPGDYIILASDGLVPSSQNFMHMVRNLNENLRQVSEDPTAKEVTDMALQAVQAEGLMTNDDRSCIVLHRKRGIRLGRNQKLLA